VKSLATRQRSGAQPHDTSAVGIEEIKIKKLKMWIWIWKKHEMSVVVREVKNSPTYEGISLYHANKKTCFQTKFLICKKMYS